MKHVFRLSDDIPVSVKNTPGIYCLWIIGGRRYVGQTKQMRSRFKAYKSSRSRAREDRPVTRAISKHGIENVVVIVLAECEETRLDDLERMYIQILQTLISENGYNIWPGIPFVRGSKHPDYCREQMRRNHADFRGSKNPFFGKKHSIETRARLVGPRPLAGRRNTELKGRPVIEIDFATGNGIRVFPSARQAANAAGVNVARVLSKCGGSKWRTPPKITWKWLSDFQSEHEPSST